MSSLGTRENKLGRHLTSAVVQPTVVIAGECITGGQEEGALGLPADDVYLRGHNTVSGPDPADPALTIEGTGQIIAAVNGVVEITDRVISVKGRASRYQPEVGDVIVGRITEVAGNKWLVDINSAQAGIMLLSNVTEPGGMLRRRERGDELGMRQLFDQADLIVAEVQRLSQDGVASLHTRAAQKYGKLISFGRLVVVNASLVKRSKHQFVHLQACRCQLIIGVNGNIWVSRLTEGLSSSEKAGSQKEARSPEEEGKSGGDVDGDARHNIARVANCLVALNRAGVPIFPKTIEVAVEQSLLAGWSSFDVLLPQNIEVLVTRVRDVVGMKRQRSA